MNKYSDAKILEEILKDIRSVQDKLQLLSNDMTENIIVERIFSHMVNASKETRNAIDKLSI